MERFKCKLCLKSFANGRALGGHMRSHMLNLRKKPEDQLEEEDRWSQLSDQIESASSSSDEDNIDRFYGLTENSNRSIRTGDPEFCFSVDHCSVLLLDRESETESNQNLTRRRSKRAGKLGESENPYNNHRHEQNVKKLKPSHLDHRTDSWAEPELLSSVSDTTTEEDVAFCLMMLSRDKWIKNKELEEEHEYGKEDNDADESEEFKSNKNRTRGKYKCETCNRVFKSYQALGGHRASHKKNKISRTEQGNKAGQENENANAEKRIHECPVCFRVFPSGQALGGHKRSHGIGNLTETSASENKSLGKQRFIDLNLPAPADDDGMSQIEASVVI